jgi:hypothetical protein
MRKPAVILSCIFGLVAVNVYSLLAFRSAKRGVMYMTRLEFAFDEARPGTAEARPKTIYVAGDRYGRIEQFADANSNFKHLILVDEPDIWLVDAVRKTAGHSANHGSDQRVHNPILGPEAPEEFVDLEYGRERKFFDDSHASPVAEEWNGIECNVREVTAGPYRVRFLVDRKRSTPVRMEAFKDNEPLFALRYLSYSTDLKFDPTLFQPPKEFAIVEAETD